MHNIQRLSNQIEDTKKLLENTHTLLMENPSDPILEYMITQDEALLASLQHTRVQATLDYLKTITAILAIIKFAI